MNILPGDIERWYLSLLLQKKEEFLYRVRSATGITNPMKSLKVALIEIEYISAEISLSDGFPSFTSLLVLSQVWIVNGFRIEGKSLSFYMPIDTVIFLELID